MNERTEERRRNDSSLHTKQQKFLAALDAPALDSLSKFCRAMCRDRTNGRCDEERAKDLISETILKAFEHFERIRDTQAFLSYTFTIAVRINRAERSKAKRWLPFSKEHQETLRDLRNAPDANADLDHLYRALDKLPQNMREAIVLSEIVGLKLEEVAAIQQSSLSAVKSRVSRGRMKLQELLGVTGSDVSDGRAEELASEKRMQVVQSFGRTAAPDQSQSNYQTRFAVQASLRSKEKL